MSRVSPTSESAADGYDQEKEDMAYCLILLAKGKTDKPPPPTAAAAAPYRCKTCFKIFPSFQALGGHRTSHNKKAMDEKKDERETTSLSLKTPTVRRVHECSVCGAGFVSGQALGGHMRRHRQPMQKAGDCEAKRLRNLVPLDLNLPAPEEDEEEERESGFSSLGEKEGIIVFSASPLSEYCHY